MISIMTQADVLRRRVTEVRTVGQAPREINTDIKLTQQKHVYKK